MGKQGWHEPAITILISKETTQAVNWLDINRNYALESVGEIILSIKGPKLWNTPPAQPWTVSSTTSFKHQVKA